MPDLKGEKPNSKDDSKKKKDKPPKKKNPKTSTSKMTIYGMK